MAGDNGKSGGPVNPFEEMSMSSEKKVDNKKANSKSDKWNKIEKGVSEDKRENLKDKIKEEVKGKAKKRRRPRRKNKVSEAKPVDNAQESIPKAPVLPQTPVVPETPPEPDPFASSDVPDNNNQAPVNPFDGKSEGAWFDDAQPQPNSSQDEKLPPKEYEDRYEGEVSDTEADLKNDVKKEDLVESYNNADEADHPPINPFAPPSEQPTTVDAKALDSTPLNERNDGVDPVAKEDDKDDPEEISQSEEQVDQSNDNPFSDVSGDQEYKEKVQDFQSGEVSEVVEVKPDDVPPEIPDAVPTEQEIQEESSDKSEISEFKEEFWDILEQAGFTKQRIVTIIIVIAIGIIGLFVWGSGWLSSSSDGVEEVSQVEEVEEQEVVEEPEPEVSDTEAAEVKSVFDAEEQIKPLVTTNYTTGFYRGALAGIETAFDVGGLDQSFEEQIVYYVDLVRRMESMYATDVYALVDRAVDRRAVLNAHLLQMDELIKEGNSAYNSVVAAMNRFDAEFEVNSNTKLVYEEQFFGNVSSLLPTSSYNSLETFIQLSKESVELKAQFNAYKIIRDMMGLSLDALEPRYRDIDSNIEALIKGIRVFDIPYSDIEAIVPVGN